MKLILSASLFFLLNVFQIQANAQQYGSVSGTVLSASGDVLAGANIIIKGTNTGTSANEAGFFTIARLDAGTYTMVISYVGFQPVNRQVTVVAGEDTRISITLSKEFQMPQIELIGTRPQRLDRVPGSAAVVSESVIMETAPISGHEVFRRITGVHAVEEEGIGLRANIGIRGLDPSKSRSVLVLEDGVPVALAPYGEPEMYYTPAMDRMSGLELVKGSGSILFGPQTFGGVLNYITADPPSSPTTNLHLRGGEGGFFTGRLGYGTTIGNTGFNVNYLRKQGDEVGLLHYRINELNSKFKFMISDNSVIGLKLGVYDETSNSTYIGLSQRMYDDGGLDFTHLAPDDVLEIRRYSASVTHDYFLSEQVTLRTTGYAYTTTRNWSRQDFDNVFNPNRTYIRTVGNPDVPGGAIFFRDQTGNRNRQFEVAGIEPRISINYMMGSMANELDAGVRYHYERAFEQRVDGNVMSPQSGNLRDDEIRTGHAYSAFVQNALFLNEKFSVTPGIRLEHFDYTRDIRRLGNEQKDIKNSDKTTAFIPGVGFNYLLRDGVSFYGGAHRGYGPPRVKDAISAQGISEELDAEMSWNFEAGTRARIADGLDMEFTAFFMNFSNQIIPVSEAAGGSGTSGASLTNGGSTEHIGMEASIMVDFRRVFQTTYGLVLNNNATFVRARFSEDRFVNDGGTLVNVKGNTVPYAPEFLMTTNLTFHAPFNLGLSLTGTYIGRQFGDVLNREAGTLDGRQGMIEAHFVVDARASYRLPGLDNASLSVAAKNLLNERYIVSRRPQGIRVGLPRFITAGIDWTF